MFRNRRYGLPRLNAVVRKPQALEQWSQRVARQQKRTNNTDLFTAAFTDISETIQRSITEPQFAAVLIVAVVLLFSHAGDIDNGPLSKIFPSDSTNSLVVWVRANVAKFFGLIVFVPAVVSVPAKFRVMVALLAATWVVIIPEASQNEYTAQAVLVALYFRVRTKNARIAVAIAIALYFMGYILTAEKKTPRVNSPSPTPKT